MQFSLRILLTCYYIRVNELQVSWNMLEPLRGSGSILRSRTVLNSSGKEYSIFPVSSIVSLCLFFFCWYSDLWGKNVKIKCNSVHLYHFLFQFMYKLFKVSKFSPFAPLCLCSSACSKQCQQSVSSSLLLLFSVRAGSAQRPSPLHATSEDHGSLKTKDQFSNPDKDKGARKKSSDSGEEVDKDFILI